MTLLRTPAIMLVSAVVAIATFVISFHHLRPDMHDIVLLVGLGGIILILGLEHALLWYLSEYGAAILIGIILGAIAIGICALWYIYYENARNFFSPRERSLALFPLINLTINFFFPIGLIFVEWLRDKYGKNLSSAYIH